MAELLIDFFKMFSISNWFLQSVAMGLTALLLPKLRVTSIFGPLLTVLALAFVNVHVWDAALFFQVPNTLTTQTLVALVVNGALFWFLVKLLPGIEIDGVLTALVAPVLFTICNLIVLTYGDKVNWAYIFSLIIDLFTYLKEFAQDGSSAVAPAMSKVAAP